MANIYDEQFRERALLHRMHCDSASADIISQCIQFLDKVGEVQELVRAAKSLLDWVPVCSIGSSGYLRQEALKKAIEEINV